MSLVHRANTSINPLLNTFYCKCALNIIRFKTDYKLQKQLGLMHDVEVPKEYTTFKQMIAFREGQAQRSILVKINSLDYISELQRFCSRNAKIINIFPYVLQNNNSFILMELESKQQVEYCRSIASYKFPTNCVHTLSPLFCYKYAGHSKMAKKKWSKDKPIFRHYDFLTPSSNMIIEQLQPMKTVSEQMMSLYDTLEVTDLNIRLRFYTAEQMSYYLSALFENMSVVPFGSSVNGFGQLGCDLDLLCKIHCNSSEHFAQNKFGILAQPFYLGNRQEQKEFLESVCIILKTCIPGISNITKILQARVPIIKFFNKNTNMQCDLSSTNIIALHMSEILYTYGQLDWRVKPLVCTIRKWARNRGVTKDIPGQWISNFSLTLLVIFYLQTRSILPSVNALKYSADVVKRTNQTAELDLSWILKWKESRSSNNNESLHNLLYGFFEYYSIFDFKIQAICVREGKLRPKKNNAAVYIYNPFDISLNVSKNISLIELSRIIDHFRSALHTLLESGESDIIINLLNLNQRTTMPKRTNNVVNPVTDKALDKISTCNQNVDNGRQNNFVKEDLLAGKTVAVTDIGNSTEDSIIK